MNSSLSLISQYHKPKTVQTLENKTKKVRRIIKKNIKDIITGERFILLK